MTSTHPLPTGTTAEPTTPRQTPARDNNPSRLRRTQSVTALAQRFRHTSALAAPSLAFLLSLAPLLAPGAALADGGKGGVASHAPAGSDGGVDSVSGAGGAGGNGVTAVFGVGGGGGGAGATGGAGGGGENTGGGAGLGGAGGATAGAAGAAGGNSTVNDSGGGGGGGGAHGYVGGAGALPGVTAAGGAGGAGGSTGVFSQGYGGGGGAGGYGAVIDAPSGAIGVAITGGAGGAGGAQNTTSDGNPGNGGSGGTGLFVQNGGNLTINSVVAGGNGGAGGTATGPGTAGLAGAGGAGIVGSGLSLTLGSTAVVTGGQSGGLASRANAITFTGGTNRLELVGGASVTGNVVAAGTSTLALGGATAATLDISQFQGFTDFAKAGTANWTLTGTSSFAGAGTVSAGTLSVDGDTRSFTSLTVNAGGTLGGSGTLGNTTIAGGTLAPGNSIGTLTVAGNLSFTSGSTYAVEVSPANADRVNVTGTATLGGAKVAATFAAGTYVAKQYTILNATGGVSGTFGTQATTNLPSGFKSGLSYDASNAYLDLTLDFTPTPTAGRPTNSGLNPNQTSVANALTNFFDRTGGIPVVFGNLTQSSLSQAAGEPATGAQQTSVSAINQFMTSLADISPAGRGVSIAPGPGGFAAYSSYSGKAAALPAKTMPPAADPDAWRWSVWANGFGGAQFLGANAGAGTAAVTSHVYGAVAGADYKLTPSTVAGFALGGGATIFNTYGLGSGSSDLFQAGAFIRHHFGKSYLGAALAYAWQDVTTDRSVTGTDHLQARFNADTWSGRLEAGHRFEMAALGVTPYAAAQLTTVSLPGYTEVALAGPGTFALSYAAKDATRTRSELGLRADADLVVAGLPLKLQGSVAWVHNYDIDTSVIATLQTLPGATFAVNGAALDRNALRTTASAELTLKHGFSITASLEGEFARNSRGFGGKGGLRYSW